MTTSHRSVRVEREAEGRYVAYNERGASLRFGTADDEFSPVELLLAAIGGCTAIDTDVATSRRTEPDEFTVTVSGDKVSDNESGNRMENLTVTFTVRFPEGERGDAARAILPRTVTLSHDKLCTVSRTIERGTPVRMVVE
ncbi:OsmC family protein [Saccharomonospora glauca]|jgi:putative redox protein|uniref:Putative redox protein, regulator of disulfide bond formation n=1 Tax=Saccharomonospora glauca K62 TaxID=928724 RepID=I1D3E3_9PSEU|nr:OsmC family protein [Saccharomonospora glauca]EIE99467.1 putative redox protein, regulator of disulfide bond formation [Saccharomonospora glauca K62]